MNVFKVSLFHRIIALFICFSLAASPMEVFASNNDMQSEMMAYEDISLSETSQADNEEGTFDGENATENNSDGVSLEESSTLKEGQEEGSGYEQNSSVQSSSSEESSSEESDTEMLTSPNSTLEKKDSVQRRTESYDWSGDSAITLALADIKESQLLQAELKLDISFEGVEDGSLLSGDTFCFSMPGGWLTAEDTDSPRKLLAALPETGEKTEKSGYQKIGQYVVKDQQVKIVFDNTEEIENLSEMIGQLELSVRYDRKSLEDKACEKKWDVQQLDDGSKRTLSIPVPAWTSINWAEWTEDFHIEIKESGADDAGRMIYEVSFGFIRMPENLPVMAGDTAVLSLDALQYPIEPSQTPEEIGTMASWTTDGTSITVTFSKGVESKEIPQATFTVASEAVMANYALLADSAANEISLGDITVVYKESSLNNQEISQDIYLVDNGNSSGKGSFTPEEYKQWFLDHAQLQVTVTLSTGDQKERLVPVTSMLTSEDLNYVNLGGSGHYKISIKEKSLPVGGKVKDDGSTVTMRWKLPLGSISPDAKNIGEYCFLELTDENRNDYLPTDSDVPNGWYYLKTFTYEMKVILRRGNIKGLEGWMDELDEHLFFSYQPIAGTDRFITIPLGELQENETALIPGAAGASGDPDIYTLTIKNIPLYRVDGTQSVYYMQYCETTASGEAGDPLSRIELDGATGIDQEDYLEITYDNSAASTAEGQNDKGYTGGSMILTLAGSVDFEAMKVWQDQDSASRPEISFQLWRYVKKEGQSYKTAAAVNTDEGPLELILKAKTTEDRFAISFDSSMKDKDCVDSESILLGEKVTLPKYTPDGYEYIYFAQEIMDEGSSYTPLYGEVIRDTDGWPALKDILPEGVTRASGDTGIYEGGTITNWNQESVAAEAEIIWQASSFQTDMEDLAVELTLMGRVKNTDVQWQPILDHSGAAVVRRLENFSAGTMEQKLEYSADRCNYLGEEMEYQWMETGVYQGGSENLLEEDGSFVLSGSNGKDFHFLSQTEMSASESVPYEYSTKITNRMVQVFDYIIEKKWHDQSGDPITIVILRQGEVGKMEKLSQELSMDGNTDVNVTCFTVDNMEVKAAETAPWHLEISGLPKYDEQGRQYGYLIMEEDGMYVSRYETVLDEDTDTYTTVLEKHVGEDGLRLRLKKNWLDDSDVEHRHPVEMTVYERTGEEQFQELKKVKITKDDFWWKETWVSKDVKEENILVLETGIFAEDETAVDPSVKISFTQDQMEKMYQQFSKIGTGEGQYVSLGENCSTPEHFYTQYYSKTEIDDILFYTVTNQRLGVIDLTVTKEWQDGNNTELRTKYKEILESFQYHLAFKLICVEMPDAVNYDRNTVAVNIGEDPVPILGYDEDLSDSIPAEKTAAIQYLQIIPEDDDGNMQSEERMYFWNLPKYNTSGEIVHYEVKEVLLDQDEKEVKGAELEEFQKKLRETLGEVYSVFESSDYTEGNLHTHDTQNLTVHNRLTGTKDVVFYKQWLDQNQYDSGKRPDITLDIYQLQRDQDDPDDLTKAKLVPYEGSNKWVKHNGTDGGEMENVSIITLQDLPKYDENGYEIFYYAREIVGVDNPEEFDYLPVYYKYSSSAGTDLTDFHSVGTESGYSGDIPTDDWVRQQNVLLPLQENGSGIWLLKENGMFVNQLYKNAVITGKKLWGQMPQGYPAEILPDITFTVYQKRKGISEKPKKVASLTITDWNNQKLPDGSYGYIIPYQGENHNQVENGELQATSLEQDPQELPQYDVSGQPYEYTVSETILIGTDNDTARGTGTFLEEAEDAEEVFQTPEVNGFIFNNFYQSEKGSLKVKKILGNMPDDIGQRPAVSISLERYYPIKNPDDTNGGWLKDDSFSQLKILNFSVLNENEKYLIFENLDIYAPNGLKYLYTVKENVVNPEFMTGFDIWGGIGEIQTDSYTEEALKKANLTLLNHSEGITGVQLKGTDVPSGTEQADVTFVNVYHPDTVTITGQKVWKDKNNESNLRPVCNKQNNGTLTVELYRYASSQQGQNNGIASKNNPLQVDSREYQVTWEEKSASIWSYTITGKGDEELAKQAPNGTNWIYVVKEALEEPYASYYKKDVSEVYAASTEERSITMNDLINSIVETVTATKTWRYGRNASELIQTDYLGYEMKVTFKLQARIDAVYNSQGIKQEGINKTWMDISDFYSAYKLGTFVGEKTASCGPKSILAGDQAWTVSFGDLFTAFQARQTVVNSGINKDDYFTVKYRVAETEIAYYAKGASVPFHKDQLKIRTTGYNPPDGFIYDFISSGDNYLFRPVGGFKMTSQIENRMKHATLTVEKAWENDSNTQYGTRPVNADGEWYTKFIVERSADNGKSWETLKKYATDGTSSNVIIELSEASGGKASLNNLPIYGFTVNDTSASLVTYRYRARELQYDGEKFTDEVVKDQKSTFYGSYEVTYRDGIKNNNDWEYITTATNRLVTIAKIDAQKKWKNNSSYTSPVTLELQYLKKGKKLESASEDDWLPFVPAAQVVLEGKKETDFSKPYYEVSAWHAVWTNIPKVVSGSATKTGGDGKPVTIYRVKEIAREDYYLVSNQGDADTGYTFTNEPTRLEISKTVDLGEYTGTFTDSLTLRLTNDSGVTGTYTGVVRDSLSSGNPEETVSVTIGKNFTLENGKTLTIYGLPKREGNQVVKYTVTESGQDGHFTTEVSVNKGSFQSADSAVISFPEQYSAEGARQTIAFQNTGFGTVYLTKVDEQGKALGNVTFQIQYKDPDDGALKNLTKDQCSDAGLIEAAGKQTTSATGTLTFTGLTLGYTYVITETDAPGGIHRLTDSIEVSLPYTSSAEQIGDAKPAGKTGDLKNVFFELTYRVSNNAVLQMPKTGMGNMFWPGLMGLLLLALAYAYWKRSAHRKETKNSAAKGLLKNIFLLVLFCLLLPGISTQAAGEGAPQSGSKTITAENYKAADRSYYEEQLKLTGTPTIKIDHRTPVSAISGGLLDDQPVDGVQFLVRCIGRLYQIKNDEWNPVMAYGIETDLAELIGSKDSADYQSEDGSICFYQDVSFLNEQVSSHRKEVRSYISAREHTSCITGTGGVPGEAVLTVDYGLYLAVEWDVSQAKINGSPVSVTQFETPYVVAVPSYVGATGQEAWTNQVEVRTKNSIGLGEMQKKIAVNYNGGDRITQQDLLQVDDTDITETGDVVEFYLRASTPIIPAASNAAFTQYVIIDQLSQGFTLREESIYVKYNEIKMELNVDYTVSGSRKATSDGAEFEGGQTVSVEMTAEGLKKLTEASKASGTSVYVHVFYLAEVNTRAQVGMGTYGAGNPGQARLSYQIGNGPLISTDWDKVTLYTFAVQGTVLLDGQTPDNVQAEEITFILYQINNQGEKVYPALAGGSGVYYRAEGINDYKNVVSIHPQGEEGTFMIQGLKEGIYYLEETYSADGYHHLLKPVEIQMKARKGNNSYVGSKDQYLGILDETEQTSIVYLTITNTKGFLLPGTGTARIWLYAVLGLAVAVAGILYYILSGRKERRCHDRKY